MPLEVSAEEVLATHVRALHLEVATSTVSGSHIFMAFDLAQLSLPGTPQRPLGAVDLQGIDFPHDPLVKHAAEVWSIAEWTWLSVSLDSANARLTEVVATAANHVRVLQDQETNGTLKILGWSGDKLKVISTFGRSHCIWFVEGYSGTLSSYYDFISCLSRSLVCNN